MQSYSEDFAKVYNKRWAFFSNSVAPKIEQLLESKTGTLNLPRSLYDICCGTGQFAKYFLQKGYKVIGIDLSPFMIDHAKTNNSEYIQSWRASFLVEDAACFKPTEKVSFYFM